MTKSLRFYSIIKTMRVLFLTIIFMVFVDGISIQAQGLGGIDLKSQRVDDLTDEQILGYMRQAEERGLGQSELELLAKQQGVSDSEILKLRRRIEQLRSGGSKDTQTNNNITSARSTQPDKAVNQSNAELTAYQKEIFGFDLFKKQGLSFAPNLSLPTPVNYQLGSGDELAIDLWGDVQQFFKF